jgi:acyl-CoA synthetase (AMP-forming)/AMP-acid ligase II
MKLSSSCQSGERRFKICAATGIDARVPCDLQGVARLHGKRVGIMATPSAEFVASIWAVWLNGAVAVPLALSYPETELVHVLTDAV